MIALTPVGTDRFLNEIVVGNIPLDEYRPAIDRPAEPRGQIIYDDDLLAGIQKLQHHVAADIAGAARDKHAHCCNELPSSIRTSAANSASRPAQT